MQIEDGNKTFSSPIECAQSIIQKEGIAKGLYAGIGAAYLRQWLYGSCRIGIYAYLLEQAQMKNVALGLAKTDIAFGKKLLMGMTSGGIGSFIGTPSELALVRLTADSKLPPTERRNYKNVVDCVVRIAKEEGIVNLWRGATVTVMRAMVLSACVLAFTSGNQTAFESEWNLWSRRRDVSRPSPYLYRNPGVILCCKSQFQSVRCREITNTKPKGESRWFDQIQKLGGLFLKDCFQRRSPQIVGWLCSGLYQVGSIHRD